MDHLRKDFGIRSELKVFVDECFERLYVAEKMIGGREFQSKCYRDKRVVECICSVSIQFKRVGLLSLRKTQYL